MVETSYQFRHWVTQADKGLLTVFWLLSCFFFYAYPFRLLASFSALRRRLSARCLSRQASQRVWSGIAFWGQVLHCPSSFRLSLSFCCWSLWNAFRSGVWFLVLSDVCLVCFLSSSLGKWRGEVRGLCDVSVLAAFGWFLGFMSFDGAAMEEQIPSSTGTGWSDFAVPTPFLVLRCFTLDAFWRLSFFPLVSGR